jgi:hypothetical protein
MNTKDEALAWIREHRIALEAAKVEGVPSLALAVVGGPIRGSWWGHPKGKLIFALANALEDSGEVVALKLIDEKTTYVHRALWPQLLRVLTDEAWRAPRVAQLSAASRKLLSEVQAQQTVRRGDAALERSLLVHAASEHTPSGRHEKVLTAWAAWATRTKTKVAKGTLDEARAELAAAARVPLDGL